MTRSKKIFVAAAILFFLFLVGLVIDISRKTTFPGARNRKGTLQQTKPVPKDSLPDTLSSKSATHLP